MSAKNERDRQAATIHLDEVAERRFDAVVVGAGPAGSVAAREVAGRGRTVLLVDRASFPRWKVCGCCVNGVALHALERIGLGHLPDQLGALPLERWQLCSPAGHVSRNLPAGKSLSREALDAGLVHEATRAGADFVDRTTASVVASDGNSRLVSLKQKDKQVEIQTSIVVAADGLSGRVLENVAGCEVDTASGSRIGTGTVVENPASYFEDRTIYMCCARGGYVGLVRLEDGRLDVAAALDRSFVRGMGTPASAATEIIRRARLPVPPELKDANWRGTPALTRKRRSVAADRIFVVGDSAGYVEPFTGEGIAWAVLTGIAVAPLVDQALSVWEPAIAMRWVEQHREILRRRQFNCRLIGGLLKRPRMMAAASRVLRWVPWIADPVIRSINASRHGPAFD